MAASRVENSPFMPHTYITFSLRIALHKWLAKEGVTDRVNIMRELSSHSSVELVPYEVCNHLT